MAPRGVAVHRCEEAEQASIGSIAQAMAASFTIVAAVSRKNKDARMLALPTSIADIERVIVSPTCADFFARAAREPDAPRGASEANCMLKVLYNRDPVFLKKRQHLRRFRRTGHA